ncbi:MAG: LLM class flavin-dependent oxidoreductase [Chloroflexi bacterium]|nr:LLM class flavin-dependent oxidoreductase [Chloroflexota bacterium]
MVEIDFRKSVFPPSREENFAYVEEIERLGYGGFWYPHFITRDIPSLDALSVLAAAAARTNRIMLGTAVLQVPLYSPVALAQALMSIDVLSNGRLVLGAGTGWLPKEYENLGLLFKERAGRMDEVLEIIRRLWTEEEVTYEGKYYAIREVRMMPKPVQKPYPKILIGGVYNAGQRGYPGEKPRSEWSERAIRRIAKVGDGWITTAHIPVENAVEVMSEAMERLKATGREMGRIFTDDEFELVVETSPFNINDDRQKAMEEAQEFYFSRWSGGFLQVSGNPSLEYQLERGVCGPAEEVAAFVQRWLDVKKGVPAMKRIQLNPASIRPTEQLRKFHEQVRPLLRR